jgi:hypothetical protein
MSRESVLARGQAAALVGMVDACTIRRLTGESTDRDTGVITETWLELYAGQCRVQQSLARADENDVGEDFQLQLRLTVQLPVTVTGLEVNDEVTITTAAHDADLTGRVFLIRDLFHKTHPTSRRVGVTERTG